MVAFALAYTHAQMQRAIVDHGGGEMCIQAFGEPGKQTRSKVSCVCALTHARKHKLTLRKVPLRIFSCVPEFASKHTLTPRRTRMPPPNAYTYTYSKKNAHASMHTHAHTPRRMLTDTECKSHTDTSSLTNIHTCIQSCKITHAGLRPTMASSSDSSIRRSDTSNLRRGALIAFPPNP